MEYWLVLQSPDAASGSRAERRVVTTGYIAKTLRRCLKLRVNGTPFVTDVACHLADEAVEGAWQDLVAAVDVASVDPRRSAVLSRDTLTNMTGRNFARSLSMLGNSSWEADISTSEDSIGFAYGTIMSR